MPMTPLGCRKYFAWEAMGRSLGADYYAEKIWWGKRRSADLAQSYQGAESGRIVGGEERISRGAEVPCGTWELVGGREKMVLTGRRIR
jgi:hypothetical protein